MKLYPKTHAGDGVENAFRHALWTAFIMAYCCKISSPKKAEIWCRKLTNFHEEIFQNPAPQKMMDLHNNHIGIEVFKQLLAGIHRQFFETSFLVEAIQQKMKNAKPSQDGLLEDKTELVYLI